MDFSNRRFVYFASPNPQIFLVDTSNLRPDSIIGTLKTRDGMEKLAAKMSFRLFPGDDGSGGRVLFEIGPDNGGTLRVASGAKFAGLFGFIFWNFF